MYKILSETTDASLVKEVNKHLGYGYELVGSPFVKHYDTKMDHNYNNGGLTKFRPMTNVCQAIIKHDKPVKEI